METSIWKDRTTRVMLGWFCGLVIASVGLIANATDTEKHDQQRDMQRQIEQVRDMEEIPFATVTTTTLVPFVGTDR